MFNLYLYDELLESFTSERAAYDFVRYNLADIIEDERELNPDLADATDEYIISLLVDPSTDGLSLVYTAS